jgi:dipeptidyl aminopeptidase/acylaminoacyl peptidase
MEAPRDMRLKGHPGKLAVIVYLLYASALLLSQGTVADYERAANLRSETQGLVHDVVEQLAWIENSHRLWYRKSIKGGNEFMVVDADTLTKQPAFDHEKLAASLSSAARQKYTAITLPFASIAFVDGGGSIEFEAAGTRWRCNLSSYACTRLGAIEQTQGLGGRGVPPPAEAPGAQPYEQPRVSPDGKVEAFIKSFNVYVRFRDTNNEFQLSSDGSESEYYSWNMQWSPDSTKLAVFRTRPGYQRLIHYIESSPADQLQPKYSTIAYNKPGDVIDVNMPALFHVDTKKQINIDNQLFATPYSNEQIRWWRDGRAFTFEYNQRGHQAYRVIEVDATTGKPRAIIDEQTPAFFCYSTKRYRYDVSDGKEIIWMSERDGWNHLYLYDGTTGKVKNQITRGTWVVRGVERVDEASRQIWFRASGMYPGKDPYFIHYYRINFDGTGLVALTEGDGNHSITFPVARRVPAGAPRGALSGSSGSFSTDMAFYIDSYSHVDMPPVAELRRTSDQKLVMVIERADMHDLIKSGWVGPESFVAKGRDGKTDIWGIICRPRSLDPSKKYPVIENIYAGPQDSYVPKSFSAYDLMQALAELGFIVVQIDGMGTSNRSKAFHDVCWKNLGDAGFPDRILWHKAVAAKYPYYDISRVGIYGTSAGGQSAMGALLFHPEFYKVAVSNSGCHDNRMDKIGWSEQWMGYPVGPEYAAASNVENANKLQGKLLLVVGELDTNVDPSSTMQVVNALIKANKYFDLLYVPGGGHGAGGQYGEIKRNDFFVRNLLGVEPPDWNKTAAVQK